jgi:hypothetical protein
MKRCGLTLKILFAFLITFWYNIKVRIDTGPFFANGAAEWTGLLTGFITWSIARLAAFMQGG